MPSDANRIAGRSAGAAASEHGHLPETGAGCRVVKLNPETR